MGANDPQGGAIFYPQGHGWQDLERGPLYVHCYTQNMKALGLVVSEKNVFFLCFSP